MINFDYIGRTAFKTISPRIVTIGDNTTRDCVLDFRNVDSFQWNSYTFCRSNICNCEALEKFNFKTS